MLRASDGGEATRRRPRLKDAVSDVLALIGTNGWRFGALCGVSLVAGLADALTLVIVVKVGLAVTGGQAAVESTLPVVGQLTISTTQLLAVAVLLLFGSLGLNSLGNVLAGRMSSQAQYSVRTSLVSSFLRSTWDVRSRETEGHLQEVLSTQVTQVTNAVNNVSSGVVSMLNFFALLGTAFFVGPLVALGVTTFMLLVFAALHPFRTLTRRQAAKKAEASLDYATAVAEVVALSQEIMLFDAGGHFESSMNQRAEDEIGPTRRMYFYVNFLPDLYQTAALGFVLAGLALITWRSNGSNLDTLGVVVLLLLRSVTYGKTIQRTSVQLVQAAPFLHRIRTRLETFGREEEASGTQPLERVRSIEVRGLSFAYQDDHEVLQDVSFRVGSGEFVGIIGPSGSGKSTLFQILVRLRNPTRGQFLVNDCMATDFDLHEWRRRVAVVPQESRLESSSIRENVRFGRVLEEGAIERALQMANVLDEVEAMPNGLDTVVGSRGSRLSGGQRQRIALARALAGGPDVVFLDEPTSALDVQSEKLIQGALGALKGKVTLFVIAHRMSTLEICDRIVVLQGGELQAFGDREALEHSDLFYSDALKLSGLR